MNSKKNSCRGNYRISSYSFLPWILAALQHPKKNTVFPHIVAAATILFWIHLVRKLFKFSFPLCNKNLNSFLTRWGNCSGREYCFSGQNKYRIYIAAATDIIAKSKEFYVYDITSVASSMGGGLGMFLGFSFLGVCKNSLDMLWNRFCKIGKIM